MRRLLREPLLHFLLLGALLFLVYGLLQKNGSAAAADEIVVSAGQVEHLASGFAKTWQRPPTQAELGGLVDDWVREEIATREATALGLDKDDSVVRRRLRQKLEFLSEDIATQTEPSEAELGAYLQAHPDAFRIEPRFSFSQVYLDPAKHGEDLARDASRLLAQLQQAGAGAELSSLGDAIMLEPTLASASSSEIARQFGDEFAVKLAALAPGRWQGPIESGYGVHLVLVRERTEGRLPELADVREAVRREWANARRLEWNGKFYEELLKRYRVRIEGLEPATR
jgi:hypothetical protein